MDIQSRPAYQPAQKPVSKPSAEPKTTQSEPPATSAETQPSLASGLSLADSVSQDMFLTQNKAASTFNFEPSEVKLPDLNDDPYRFHGPFVENDGRKLNFFHGALSTEKPVISVEVREPSIEDYNRAHAESSRSFGQDYEQPIKMPKIRSPYLKELGKQTAENLITNPIEEAWDKKEFTPEAGRGALIAGALAGAALFSGSETKFSTRLASTEMAGYDVKLKAGLKAGDGELGMRSVGLSLRPQVQEDNVRSGFDLKYDFEDSAVNFSYSRTVDYGGSGFQRSIGHFNASIYHNEKENDTGARISYHINF